jgi:hypothetical protein
MEILEDEHLCLKALRNPAARVPKLTHPELLVFPLNVVGETLP